MNRLLADGVPDRRGPALTAWGRTALVNPEAGIDWLDGSPAAELLAGLDERMAAVADCGLPDTLVHGDAHPGNLRGDGVRLVFLDWSECFLRHPAFDALRLVDGLPEAEAQQVLAAWASSWQRIVPDCDPGRALELLRPVTPLLWAAVYARFLANIEPAEWGYHLEDIPRSLAEAVAADQSPHQSPNQGRFR
jgi:Ser/Thr protein kinase RdoA (MazF antagonist)